ncbi:MAG: alpha/beta fold hydrolase [Planctomycetota bacterium]
MQVEYQSGRSLGPGTHLGAARGVPDRALIEEPLQFGSGGRLFGILTHPQSPAAGARELPTFLLLNSGFLHRVGPSRLYVRLARSLAARGFTSVRIDLSGRGDSTRRTGVTHEQSVVDDYAEVAQLLEARFGAVTFVLGGLCAGADNAIRLSIRDERIVGMLLLDPICFPDDGFKSRARAMKYSNPARYGVWLRRRLERLFAPPIDPDDDELYWASVDPLSLRDLPNREEMRAAFQAILERDGRVLSTFSGYSLSYYNQVGQLRRVLELNDPEERCTEMFWPEADHTYPLESHRRRLIACVETWANGYEALRAERRG